MYFYHFCIIGACSTTKDLAGKSYDHTTIFILTIIIVRIIIITLIIIYPIIILIVPVYLEYPDLTGKGQECAVRALAEGFNEGVSCFQEVRL